MSEKNMAHYNKTSHISDVSAEYIDALYEQFLIEPKNVPPTWQDYFSNLSEHDASVEVSHKTVRDYYLLKAKNSNRVENLISASSISSEYERKQVKVLEIIAAYRNRGHQIATLDPLGLMQREMLPELTLHYYGLSEVDLDLTFQTGTLFLGKKEATLLEIMNCLNDTYCESIGAEYMHIVDTKQRRWLQEYMESVNAKPAYTAEEKTYLYERLVAAEGLESYLATRYPGTKRFGLEGGESLIPALDECIHRLGGDGVKEIVIAMAHRGRLNVLVNILGKKPKELFNEFDGQNFASYGAGDVKYHQGFSSQMKTTGGNVHMALMFNPSHLEIVAPVVEGSVRARQDRRNDANHDKVVPIIIHGDAAFAGQGVVMETFQMSQIRGFHTGGTIHLVINNQVGFTTNKREDARSTEYCTDVAKMVQTPIFHVNADDPEAVLFVTQLAVDYRLKFKMDVVIDLICYRRRGHNEADEPSGTQPLMYKEIKKHRTTLGLYGDKLIKENVLTTDTIKEKNELYRKNLTSEEYVVRALVADADVDKFVDWSSYVNKNYIFNAKTDFDLSNLKAVGENILTLPEGFVLQRQVNKVIEKRKAMNNGEIPVDWGFAENLAYATLLKEHYNVRLVGQDSGRGTFSHRHAVLHNQVNGESYIPLKNIPDSGWCAIYDSFLSEEAVLGFEYGYAATSPKTLVIWEAQFGDFVNGAQVLIDQFISSGEMKWNRLCGLTLLLPHGYEGQGPEHSSARLERFLQLCAQTNMEVCIPTTPAQIFHLLRRQMHRKLRRPLIIMSPKSLLRHAEVTSSLEELATGGFQLILDDEDVRQHNAYDKVKKVVLCSGKVYYDLKAEQNQHDNNFTHAIIRLEQIYPCPVDELMELLAKYQNVESIVWCQEEPRNQGAYYRIAFELNADLLAMNKNWRLSYAGRPAAASPAVGFAFLHAHEQLQLVREALDIPMVKSLV